MTQQLENRIRRFLKRYLDASKPVVLAFSGGADSTALLYLLVALQREMTLDLHVMHVDHGWRQESSQEAQQLKLLAEKHCLPFYCRRLKECRGGNLEAYGRQERLRFFEEVCREIRAQAVLLAHHADDQAETVLKTVLQGNALPFLAGMQKVTNMGDITLWRPLLEVSKREINDWLLTKGYSFFEDITNHDCRFLRARLREEVIPQLSQAFGKEVGKGLCRLGKEAEQLRRYLDARIEPQLASVRRGRLGVFLAVEGVEAWHDMELQHLVRRFCAEEGVILPSELVDAVCQLLRLGVAHRKVCVAEATIFVDRKHLFLVTHPLSERTWKITIQGVSSNADVSSETWKQVWTGRCRAILPERDYTLSPPIMAASYPRGSAIRKWWSNHKVPAFLRENVPVLWADGNIEHEFLTGQCKQHKEQPLIEVTLEVK